MDTNRIDFIVAKVVKSETARGWGLALSGDGQTIFIHEKRHNEVACDANGEVIKLPNNVATSIIPRVDEEIVIKGLLPPHIGNYPQAQTWARKSNFDAMFEQVARREREARERADGLKTEATEVARKLMNAGTHIGNEFNPSLWHKATVIPSERALLCRMADGLIVELVPHKERCVYLRTSEPIISDRMPTLRSLLSVGQEVLFAGVTDVYVNQILGRVQAVASTWLVKEPAMKMVEGAKKAKETLAKLAEQAAEVERRRQESIQRALGMKGQSGKKKQKAGAR